MKVSAYVILLVLVHCFASYLPPDRLTIKCITPAKNTGQSYDAWQTDNLDSLIPSIWSESNFRYVDVRLELESRSSVTKISLYDYEGKFPDNPASLYAVDGNEKTLIGYFNGEAYKEFVNLIPSVPIAATAIIVHKYCNNLPQKIRIYGNILTGTAAPTSLATAETSLASTSDSIGPVLTDTKIPIDPKRWFQLTNATNGNENLFDGDTTTKVETGWGKIIENYDHYYPVLPGERIDLSSIRMFDGEGEDNRHPLTISIIDADGERINIGKFIGKHYQRWVGPNPDKPEDFQLQTSFKNIRYIVLNSWNFFPTELQFTGNYTAPPEQVILPMKAAPLRHMFGINGFEWNFEAPKNPSAIDARSMAAARAFTGFRHYMDWEKLESTQGSYSFNPTLLGGWNYDILYDSCKAAGIEVLACLKTLPPWMIATYPANERDNENVPVRYGSDFSKPASYIEQAKVGFQFAARYGRNKRVDPSLIKLNTSPRWPGDKINQKKIGLGTVQYIECENERDKWWKGRKAYQTAYEYAANLSAFYDGHKRSMGTGVGVKNADSSMMVVMAGTALASTDYLEGMIDWCRRFRGLRADGSIDLCWDIINYHYYSNDSKVSQNGKATRGAAPEGSGAIEAAAAFVEVASRYSNSLPVWVTELGYDANRGSTFKAIPLGSKTALETQADWILRSALLYARTGIQRTFFYGMYDDNLANPLQFSSSGLINENKTRKPAADFIAQVNKTFGEYHWVETINSYPIVDRYELSGKSMYMIVLPDEKGNSLAWQLKLPGIAKATIYTPVAGRNEMNLQVKSLANGKLGLTATETPVFVTPNVGGNIKSAAVKIAQTSADATAASNASRLIQVYPNPATDEINVLVANGGNEKISVQIVEAASGKVVLRQELEKTGKRLKHRLDMHLLPPGYYIVDVQQGSKKITQKILKQVH